MTMNAEDEKRMSPEEYKKILMTEAYLARSNESNSARERLSCLNNERDQLLESAAQGIPTTHVESRVEYLKEKIEVAMAEQAKIDPKWDDKERSVQSQADHYQDRLNAELLHHNQDRINLIEQKIALDSEDHKNRIYDDGLKGMRHHMDEKDMDIQSRDKFQQGERKSEIGEERFNEEVRRASQEWKNRIPELSGQQLRQEEEQQRKDQEQQRKEQERKSDGPTR